MDAVCEIGERNFEVSAVHEKLKDIPAGSEAPASASPNPAVSAVAPSATAGKKGGVKKRLPMILFSALVVASVIGAGVKVWLAVTKAQREAQPIKRDPVIVATEHLQSENFKAASEVLEEIVKADPKNVAAHINLAFAYKKMANFEAAKTNLEKAIELSPNDYVAHNNLGRMYLAQGKLTEALASHLKALEIRADYPEGLFNAAAVHEALKQWAPAVENYEKFLAVDSEHKDLHDLIRQRLRRLRAFRTYAEREAKP